tara:strand:+ start:218 stop:427 length:210 start_codon:yes stop_codon:yes gene_type:complete
MGEKKAHSLKFGLADPNLEEPPLMDGARRVELGELGHLRAHVERLQRRQRAPERLEQIALVLRVRKRRI